MRKFLFGLLAVAVFSSTAVAADFEGYDGVDVAMAMQVIKSSKCTEEQKAALDELVDAADLSAYASGKTVPSNAAHSSLIKAAVICH
ncbi:hypothetical protein [Oleidesulfovibrio alaskensis]